MDVKRYPRFRRPGGAVTGDRRRTTAEMHARPGYDCFHAIVDDHSRLAYGELLADERAATVTAFVARALAWFDARGITARRVMTDGAWSYTHNTSLRALLRERAIRHIVTPPYTPRWNGKVERFHQTMDREWAKGLRYRNSTARNRALPHWLRHYNERRPHSSLGGQPPISRAPNLPGHDSYPGRSPSGHAARRSPPDALSLARLDTEGACEARPCRWRISTDTPREPAKLDDADNASLSQHVSPQSRSSDCVDGEPNRGARGRPEPASSEPVGRAGVGHGSLQPVTEACEQCVAGPDDRRCRCRP